MNTDIRISASFPAHPKTRKLSRRLGAPGVLSLVYLWLFVGQNRPDGDLYGLDAEDVALASQWEGEPEEFVSTLEKVGFLERTDSGLVVHDWAENNPWAAGAKERSERAKRAAEARWRQKENGKEMPAECAAHAPGMQAAQNGNAPSPLLSSPSPTEISSPGGEERSYITKRKRKLKGKQLDWFEEFWNAFAYKEGRAPAADVWLDQKITADLVPVIVEKAAAEARRRPDLLKAGRTPKMAQGWLSERRWEDEAGQVVQFAQREPLRVQEADY